MSDSSCLVPHLMASTGYSYGCRCDRCAGWCRDQRRALPESDVCAYPDRNVSTSYQYGCRCLRCRTGWAEYNRNLRQRKKCESFGEPQPCACCGKEFRPVQHLSKCCSKKCYTRYQWLNSDRRAESIRRRPPVCDRCGVDLGTDNLRRRLCAECRRQRENARTRAKWLRRLERVNREEALLSSKPFGPFVEELSLDNIGPAHGPFVEECRPPCVLCGRTNYRRSEWCSDSCYNLGGRGRELLSDLAYGTCPSCGALFCGLAGREKIFCSDVCGKRERRRRRKHRERADVREPYTLREIAERDGWRCHICKRSVPDRPYRARPNDPTIDHLDPISLGGDDTRRNVALAHNVCNMKRSNKGPAQLRLIG
jgi:hypothetical protein